MTGRRFSLTDIGKQVKRKLSPNGYFLQVPVPRFTAPSFPAYSALWSTGDLQQNSSWPLVLLGTWMRPQLSSWPSRKWGTQIHLPPVNSLAWESGNNIEKEQNNRGRDRIQFSRVTLNRLHHGTIPIFLRLLASFTIHVLLLTNKQSGCPIGESLPYFPKHVASFCTEWGGVLCKKYIWTFNKIWYWNTHTKGKVKLQKLFFG